MSSISYSSEIAPEPRLRRLVLAAGWTALLAGFLIILSLPVIGILRAVVATAWCAIVSAELRFISSAHKRFTGIRITSDGECALRNQNGHWEEAIIARSSVVLPQLAWLQLKASQRRLPARADSR